MEAAGRLEVLELLLVARKRFDGLERGNGLVVRLPTGPRPGAMQVEVLQSGRGALPGLPMG